MDFVIFQELFPAFRCIFFMAPLRCATKKDAAAIRAKTRNGFQICVNQLEIVLY